jgi:hypothetical protein
VIPWSAVRETGPAVGCPHPSRSTVSLSADPPNSKFRLRGCRPMFRPTRVSLSACSAHSAHHRHERGCPGTAMADARLRPARPVAPRHLRRRRPDRQGTSRGSSRGERFRSILPMQMIDSVGAIGGLGFGEKEVAQRRNRKLGPPCCRGKRGGNRPEGRGVRLVD